MLNDPLRVMLRDGATRRSWTDLHGLLTQLREAGISGFVIVGGGPFGADAIHVDSESDADRAIALLAGLGIADIAG
jgi:hypothetical protein